MSVCLRQGGRGGRCMRRHIWHKRIRSQPMHGLFWAPLDHHHLFLVCLPACAAQVRDVLVPLMHTWVPLVTAALSSQPGINGSSSSSRAWWGIQSGALRLAHQLVTFFAKPLAAAMPVLMTAVWQLMVQLQVGPAAAMHWQSTGIAIHEWPAAAPWTSWATSSQQHTARHAPYVCAD